MVMEQDSSCGVEPHMELMATMKAPTRTIVLILESTNYYRTKATPSHLMTSGVRAIQAAISMDPGNPSPLKAPQELTLRVTTVILMKWKLL